MQTDGEVPLVSSETVVYIAHRGSIVPGPENTITAFRHAIKCGADVLEIDLRCAKDGEIVIIHDGTLARTTNGGGNVIDYTVSELKKLDAGGGERIPTFEEVLQLVAGTDVWLLLDMKEYPVMDNRKVVRLIRKYKATQKVIIASTNPYLLQEFRTIDPNLRTLGFVQTIRFIEQFVQEVDVDIIRLKPGWIYAHPDLVTKVHRLNKPVWVTAQTRPREDLEKLIELGVDGIFSSLPEVMNEVLTEMKNTP
jgi:glycerophosphoryl diester phosphodiesterase